MAENSPCSCDQRKAVQQPRPSAVKKTKPKRTQAKSRGRVTSEGTEQNFLMPRPVPSPPKGPGGRRKAGGAQAAQGQMPAEHSDREETICGALTFKDLVDAGVPHILLDGVVFQVAIATVHLQGLVADLQGDGGEEPQVLGRRSSPQASTWAYPE